MASRTFQSFAYHNYRLWFASNFSFSTGAWMQRVAQDWLVLTVLTDHSGFAVGIVTGLQFLPQLLFSLVAGLLADRFDPRRIIQSGYLLLSSSGLILGLLTVNGLAQLWHVYILAFLLGTAESITSPARQAFVSSVVPAEALTNAVALNSAAFNGARLVGPGVAGLVIAAVGSGWVFLANAGFFLIPVLTLAFMRTSELHRSKRKPRQKGLIREGWRYVLGRSDLVAIIIIATVVGMLGLNFQLTQAVMATQVFGKGAGEYGMLGSIMAIGSMIGAIFAARRRTPRVGVVIAAAFCFGIAEGLCALAPTYLSFAIALVPTGFCVITLLTGANTAIQISTDPEIRGRVLSIYLLFFLGCTPIGSPVIGWVAEHWGARWSLGVGAISALVVSTAVAIWVRHSWQVEVKIASHKPFLEIYGPRERAAQSRDEAAGAAAASAVIDPEVGRPVSE